MLFVAVAARAGGGALGWDDSVSGAVADAVPVASNNVHVDPYLEGVTLAVGVLTLALGAWLLLRRSYRGALFLAAAVGGILVLSRVVKELVERPPIEGPADEFSFPSGSSAWSFATVTAFVLLARTPHERLAAALAGAVLVFAFGVVIVWEQWHYPSDVVGGWALGLGWTCAAWLALGRPSAPGRVDTAEPGGQYSGTGREERTAAAPSAPHARTSGGTDTAA